MDKKDLLKSVLQNFINDKPEEAKADFHQYLTLKSKEITGIGANVAQETAEAPESTETPEPVEPEVTPTEPTVGVAPSTTE